MGALCFAILRRRLVSMSDLGTSTLSDGSTSATACRRLRRPERLRKRRIDELADNNRMDLEPDGRSNGGTIVTAGVQHEHAI